MVFGNVMKTQVLCFLIEDFIKSIMRCVIKTAVGISQHSHIHLRTDNIPCYYCFTSIIEERWPAARFQ